MENIAEGITVGGQLITAIRFADDQAMVASSEEGLQVIMNQQEQVSRQYEMKINVNKTKVLVISKKLHQRDNDNSARNKVTTGTGILLSWQRDNRRWPFQQ